MIRRKLVKQKPFNFRVIYYPNQDKYTLYKIKNDTVISKENTGMYFGEPYFVAIVEAFDEVQAISTAIYQLREFNPLLCELSGLSVDESSD